MLDRQTPAIANKSSIRSFDLHIETQVVEFKGAFDFCKLRAPRRTTPSTYYRKTEGTDYSSTTSGTFFGVIPVPFHWARNPSKSATAGPGFLQLRQTQLVLGDLITGQDHGVGLSGSDLGGNALSLDNGVSLLLTLRRNAWC